MESKDKNKLEIPEFQGKEISTKPENVKGQLKNSNDGNQSKIINIDWYSKEISIEPENAKNQLNMYMHPDGLYHAAKPSLISTSWFYFKQMFQAISNGFKNKRGEEANILQKIWVVGHVLFTCAGCLSLLIALGVFLDVGIGSLFFIYLGIGGSLLGIIIITSLIIGAIIRHQMLSHKFYCYCTMTGKQEIFYETQNLSKDELKNQNCKPYDLSQIDTSNWFIPRS